MARREIPSSVDRLPPAVRARVEEMRLVERRHIDEIRAWLVAGGYTISRSALGRHLQSVQAAYDAQVAARLAEMAPAMQIARSIAAGLVERLEAAGDGSPAYLRATRELIEAQLFRLVSQTMSETATDRGTPGLTPKDFFAISRSLQTLAQAERTEATRLREEEIGRIRREERAAEQQRAAAAVEAVARREKGLSAETVLALRKAVLGDA
ncbi:MAG: phage protein Gp27 family protein [Sphingomonadaceae bacterium]